MTIFSKWYETVSYTHLDVYKRQVYGIDQAMYGEIVVFENGVKGMVQDVRRNEIGVILFGRDTGIKEGTKVTCLLYTSRCV